MKLAMAVAQPLNSAGCSGIEIASADTTCGMSRDRSCELLGCDWNYVIRTDQTIAEMENFFLDLLAATLAVNRFSLSQAFDVARRRGTRGLTRPDTVAQMDESVIANELKLAGYNRGEYMAVLMGSRIVRLANSLSDAELQQLVLAEKTGDFSFIERQLLTHPGVGPVVIENLRMLRSDE